MSSLNDIDIAILEAGVEDYCYFFETVSMIRQHVSGSEEEVRRLGEASLRSLLGQGLIEIFRGGRFRGEEELLSLSDAMVALEANENWEAFPSHGDTAYRFAASKAGEAEYYRSAGTRA